MVPGDVTKRDTLVDAFKGKDAVLSAIGAHGTSMFNKTELYSQSIECIADAMRAYVFFSCSSVSSGSLDGISS